MIPSRYRWKKQLSGHRQGLIFQHRPNPAAAICHLECSLCAPECRKLMEPEDVSKIDESTLEKVDRVRELRRKFGLHASLNFHREAFVHGSDSRSEDQFRPA